MVLWGIRPLAALTFNHHSVYYWTENINRLKADRSFQKSLIFEWILFNEEGTYGGSINKEFEGGFCR